MPHSGRALLPYIIKHWQKFGSFFLDTGLIPPGYKKKKRERERGARWWFCKAKCPKGKLS
jgi:hypothetical protein